MGSKLNRVIISVVLAIVIEGLMVAIFFATGGIEGEGIANRLAELFGGNFMAGGYVQALEYIGFFWGILEINAQMKILRKEKSYLDYQVLPDEEHAIIGATEVNQIRMRVTNYLQQKRSEYPDQEFFLLKMVKNVATKFRSNYSVTEAMEIVNSQSQINVLKAESDQSNIRYAAWVIPTVGFIGTVLGISQALGIADSGDTNLITSTLGVAFDTTLVALILSVVLMYMIHQLQEQTDKLHTSIQEYVMENLINRIDVR